MIQTDVIAQVGTDEPGFSIAVSVCVVRGAGALDGEIALGVEAPTHGLSALVRLGAEGAMELGSALMQLAQPADEPFRCYQTVDGYHIHVLSPGFTGDERDHE